MDESLREILTRHWHLVVRYLNPSDDFVSTILVEKVLPSSMADDIRKGKNRQEKNERLLKSLKLRGNSSYRKFIDILMRFDQVFLADLLSEEEQKQVVLVEESDLSSFPSFKLSLTPEDQKMLISVLDSKIRSRLLQTDWQKDSNRRLECLKTRCEEQRANRETTIEDYKEKLRNLKAEVKSRNEALSQLVVEMNAINDDVIRFIHRHQASSSVTIIKHEAAHGQGTTVKSSSVPTTGSGNVTKTRFKFFDNHVDSLCRQLSCLIGEDLGIDEQTSSRNLFTLETLVATSAKIHEFIRDLEASIYRHSEERETTIELLFPSQGKSNKDLTIVQCVQQFMAQEQKSRCSLLKEIDFLSRRLRGLTNGDCRSALKALKQSAVTGKPSPEIVDYRFLSNHVALLTADAEHINKKLGWKDNEILTLATELKRIKGRLTTPRDGQGQKM